MRDPWDLLRGRDVFRDVSLLEKTLSFTEMAHWAPNCATFSKARERPIPGVKNAPKPVRNETHPEGIPSALSSMSVKSRKRLELDTEMADMAARDCLRRHRNGKRFGLEHPEGSIARQLPSWRELQEEPGVFCTKYHACMFSPCKRRKRQVLIHNVPELDEGLGLVCHNERCCERTGLAHLSWKPKVDKGKVVSFSTGDEREYPLEFCERYAEAMRKHHGGKGDFSFVEIFSGPNAPLSCAMARAFGEDPPPPPSLVSKMGTLNELSRIEELQGGRESFKAPRSEPLAAMIRDEVEYDPYRKAAVDAGRQPTYGKRLQLIPDSEVTPEEHLSLAKKLEHPFSGEGSLKEDHRKVIKSISADDDISRKRLLELDKLRKLVSSCNIEQESENKKASWTAKRLGVKPKTVAMRRLQEALGLEDIHVPDACLYGLPILGKASESEFFTPFEVRPTLTWEDFHSGLEASREKNLEKVKRMAQMGSPELSEAIFLKTEKEVQKGTMGPPMTLIEAYDKYQGVFNVVPSFGLEQGTDESGNKKFRRIDDHSACGNNAVSHRMQKVPMTMVDYIGALIKFFAKFTEDKIELTSEDMKGAYRQIALSPDNVRYSITAVYNPWKKSVFLHEMYGQPFGAGHAVPNFCRVSEWLSRCLGRVFSLALDHFFDDFFLVDKQGNSDVASFCLREGFSILGFELDPDKSQPPSQVIAILGVVFNTQAIHLEKRLLVEAKPLRVRNMVRMIDRVLEQNHLSPSVAASLVGKFQFLCSTLFGKLGRCCTGAIRKRQYSNFGDTSVTADIDFSLRMMKDFLRVCPSRRVMLNQHPPVIIYTDASDVPNRTPRQVLGAVVYEPLEDSLHYSWAELPHSVMLQWDVRESYMGQLELLATLFGLKLLPDLVQNRQVIIFIDNDSAASNLVRGYSKISDSSAIVGEFWLTAATLNADIYCDRVSSKSNLADPPSRLESQLLESMGANWTEPVFDRHGSPSVSPCLWFGAATQQSRGES